MSKTQPDSRLYAYNR